MIIDIKVDEKDLARVRELLNTSRFKQIYDETIHSAALDLEGDIADLQAQRAANTGHLNQSWHTAREGFAEFIVGTPVPYAPFAESGTEPHYAPFRYIYEWARLKFRISAPNDIYGIARAVWKKIAEKGTQGKWFVKDSVEEFNLSRYIEDLMREWDNVR